MDITHFFKAGVMAAKLKRKSDSSGVPPVPDKNRILAKTTKEHPAAAAAGRDEFAKQANEICHKITTLRNVLLENRSAYMRIGQHLKSSAQMTDQQRDVIDRESEKFVSYYTQHLAQLRGDWKRAKRKPQQRAHLEAVLELLEAYLRSVQQIYLEQRKYRVQHELETYRLLKLAADKKKIPVRPAGESSGRRRHSDTPTSSDEEASEEEEDVNSNTDNSDDSWDMDGWKMERQRTPQTPKTRPRRQRDSMDSPNVSSSAIAAGGSGGGGSSNDVKSQSQSSQKVALDEDIQKSQQVDEERAAHDKLSPDDVQLFEQENVQLYHELQGLSEEVEQIEKNVVDIAQLQDIFTEKVSLQQHNIERIANVVVGATENVKDANEQIKQAIQRNAGLRVWSLFFLLVMSFALLFLDWYYD